MKFILKARSGYEDIFRKAFNMMEAKFIEKFVGDDVIIFDVECSQEKIGILEEIVPIEAYASMGFLGSGSIDLR